MRLSFNLTLCGGKITYQDLLKHLSITFQGGDDKANILAKFYSSAQHAKELEDVFANELQLLARKVISKKPDFRINLDTTLKQWYANQLYDRNSTSIAQTLLLQMLHVFFTQFRNELAKVLGTHQCSNKSSSSKSVSVPTIGVKSEEEEPISKSQHKWEKKISAQSSQIKDLCTKLDGSIAQSSHSSDCIHECTAGKLNSGQTGQVSFWVSNVNQSLQLAKMGLLTQRKLTITAWTWVIMLTIVCACKSERLSCHVKVNLGVG